MSATLDMMMFADDIVLLSTGAQRLRKHLKTLENYCNKCNLQINAAKRKVSIFDTNYIHQLYCNSLPLEVVGCFSTWEFTFPKKEISRKPYTTLPVNLRK